MLITATQKYTRQSPRKVRLVANQVKKLALPNAIEQLAVIERRSTMVILKTLRQAIANAMNNHGVALEDLQLKNIIVTEGPRYRRFQAVSRGRAHGIVKRTSHVVVTLEAPDAVVGSAKPAAPAKKLEKKSTAPADIDTTKTQASVNSAAAKSRADVAQAAQRRASRPQTTKRPTAQRKGSA
jgi:large subunit ribosomal protein L22